MMDSRLSERLLQLLFEDQGDLKRYRAEMLSLEGVNRTIHARTEEVRKIFKTRFPVKRLVGEDAYKAFIVLILHSDDPSLMEAVAKTILASKIEDADKSHAAYIIDKLLVREGKSQRYGTQYRFLKEDGSVSFFPFEEPDIIDELRLEVGLPSIKEYEETIRRNQS